MIRLDTYLRKAVLYQVDLHMCLEDCCPIHKSCCRVGGSVHCGMSSTEELPQAGDIEVEYDDLYRQDEEQAYVTLMSQEVASLNFAAEANYTVRLCKEIVHFHNPEEMPMGSFELIASNKVWLPPPALPAIHAER